MTVSQPFVYIRGGASWATLWLSRPSCVSMATFGVIAISRLASCLVCLGVLASRHGATVGHASTTWQCTTCQRPRRICGAKTIEGALMLELIGARGSRHTICSEARLDNSHHPTAGTQSSHLPHALCSYGSHTISLAPDQNGRCERAGVQNAYPFVICTVSPSRTHTTPIPPLTLYVSMSLRGLSMPMSL